MHPLSNKIILINYKFYYATITELHLASLPSILVVKKKKKSHNFIRTNFIQTYIIVETNLKWQPQPS